MPGETGTLCDIEDLDKITADIIELLSDETRLQEMSAAARAHVVQTYDFLTKCLPEHIAQMNALVPEGQRIALPRTPTT